VLVREAARAASQGMALPELVALIEELKPRTRLVGMVDSLEYLRRGGRIGRVAALVGGLLSVKVLITVADGEVVPLEKVRTRARALQRIEQLAAEGAPFTGDLVVGHSDDPEEAAELAKHLRAAYPNQPLQVCEVGPAIGTHAGPGAIGVAFIAGPTR
jgi:DegV family protein with EDD domain